MTRPTTIDQRHALNCAYFAADKVDQQHTMEAGSWMRWRQGQRGRDAAFALEQAEENALIAYAAGLEARALYREAVSA